MENTPEHLDEPSEKIAPEKVLRYYSTWQVRCGNCLLTRAADTVFTCTCPSCKKEWEYYAHEEGRQNRVSHLKLPEISFAQLAAYENHHPQETRRVRLLARRTAAWRPTEDVTPSSEYL